MNIKTFVQVISALPPEISVLAKGPTGIGKSHIVHQIAKNLDLEVIDRRLSQMTEGDIIGLPELIDGVTRFAPVNWFVEACNNPVVLFFDELNRATIEVQQCAFQIVLDRELNGHKLHPGTRVYAAVNEGSDYQVTDMDPALLRRFYAVELEPTTEDWLNWAKSKERIDRLIIDFIQKYPAHLRHVGEMVPGTVYPNPASWERLDRSLKYANVQPSFNCADDYQEITFPMSIGFIGETTSAAFVEYIKNYKYKFSAKDVLNDYHDLKLKINDITNDQKNDILNQIVNYSAINEVSITQVENVYDFCQTLSDEMSANFMLSILSIGLENKDNIVKYNKYFSKVVLGAFHSHIDNK
jgi:hypothetical protein